jgi:hypothetical protein
MSAAAADPLEEIVKETRHQFIIAKADGVLETGEVVQIAIGVARKLQKLAGLSGAEKKALALLALKKGLDAAGGVASLPGLKEASSEMQALFEKQILAAAGAALDVAVAVAAGKIDLRKPGGLVAAVRACLPGCVAAVGGLVPANQPLLKEALGMAEAGLSEAMGAPATEATGIPATEAGLSEAAPAPAAAEPTPVTPPSSPSEVAETPAPVDPGSERQPEPASA